MSKLDNFISKQKENSSSQIDPEQELNIWKKAVSFLYKEVRDFLSVYIDSGDVEIKPGTTTIFEEYIGEYEIETATIEIVRKRINLKPIGRVIIGAKGRVDMIGPYGVVTLLLVEDTDARPNKVSIKERNGSSQRNAVIPDSYERMNLAWVSLIRSPEIKYVRLSQESFIDAMLSIIDEQ